MPIAHMQGREVWRQLPQRGVFRFQVGLGGVGHAGQRCPEDALPAAVDELHINVFPVGFKECLGLRLRRVGLHQGKGAVAIQIMPAKRLGAIEAAQESKSQGKTRIQARVAVRMVESIEDHLPR